MSRVRDNQLLEEITSSENASMNVLGDCELDAAGSRKMFTRKIYTQGVGARSAVAAHAAMQVPRPALHAMMAGGAPTMVTPKVNPAAA